VPHCRASAHCPPRPPPPPPARTSCMLNSATSCQKWSTCLAPPPTPPPPPPPSSGSHFACVSMGAGGMNPVDGSRPPLPRAGLSRRRPVRRWGWGMGSNSPASTPHTWGSKRNTRGAERGRRADQATSWSVRPAAAAWSANTFQSQPSIPSSAQRACARGAAGS
jgi:hypothetical protein